MELLIVIAIIAILAAALVVGINPAGRFRAARNATRWQHMETISTAVYSYAIENLGNFPAECIADFGGAATPITVELDADGNATGSTWCLGAELVVPEYLRIPPEDPTEGATYTIEFADSNHESIKIASTAEEAIADDIYLIK